MVDGPCGIGAITASCDLIKLAAHLNSGARGFIDHRWRTANLAQELVGDRLELRYLPSLESYEFRARRSAASKA